MSNIDSRGVKRGNCLDCSCALYERDPETNRSMCGYCGCVPMKHIAIDGKNMQWQTKARLYGVQRHQDTYISYVGDSPETEMEIPYEDDTSPGEDTPHEGDTFCREDTSHEGDTEDDADFDTMNEKASTPEDLPRAVETQKNMKRLNKGPKQSRKSIFIATENVNLKDLVPISFKPDIEQGLMNGYLLPTQENAIIRYTCNNMKSKSKTSNSDISQMATFLLDMYPVLNSNTSVGISQSDMVKKITRCLKNSKRPCTNKENNCVIQLSIDEACEGMKKEMEKADRKQNITLLKTWLNCTRCARKSEACLQTAKVTLEKYPALKKDILIFWEFGKLVNIEASILQKNWSDALPRISSLFLSNEDLEKFSKNGQTLQLLEILPRLLPSKESTNKALLKVYDHGTLISEIIPDKNVEPYLIGIGNTEFTNINLMCYVDGEPLFTTNAYEAVPLLIASYWVFQVNFPKPLRRQLSLLSAFFFRNQSERILSKDLTTFSTVKRLLKEAEIF